ncbi:MAG TPA: DUF3592 domain-containing protein [Roseiflexaceae bacterium]|nr:DUF3592 domain-containing protein [Roseiflexaceae bacterium]
MLPRLVFSLAVAAVPLGLVWWLGSLAWRDWRRARAARLWPQARGRIVRSEVQEVLFMARGRYGRGWFPQWIYRPRIVYRYRAGGADHEGERLHLIRGVATFGRRAAERAVARLPLGAPVTVFYNPDNPAEAALDTRAGWETHLLWFSALLALVFVLALVAMIVSS